MNATAKVTIKDIARKAGCGVGTVSDIVNRNKLDEYSEKTIARIRGLAEEMGYVTNRQASSLRTGKTRTIGITHGFMNDLQSGFNIPYSNQIYSGLGHVLDRHNYSLLFQSVRTMTGSDGGGVAERLRRGEVDGLIYIYFSSFKEQFEKEHAPVFKQAGVPVVIVHTTDKYFPFPGVGLDVEKGVHMVMEHLLGHGYGSIGFVGHPATGELNEAFYRGYTTALETTGMPLNRDHVYEVLPSGGVYGETLAEKIAAQGSARPRALFCTEDSTANGLMKAFARLGVSVPDDIALMGFGDNISDKVIWTTLSSFVQPGLTKGRTAGEMLLKQLGDPEFREVPDTVILEPKLSIRTSCGCK